MHSRLFITIFSVFLLVALLTACGYRFGAEGADSKFAKASVYVAPFENKTKEAYLDHYLRNALIDWFMKTAKFQVVLREEEADLILEGKIRQMYTLPISYRSGNLAAEEKVRLHMEVALKDRKTGRTVWEEKNMIGEQDYSVVDLARREDTRRAAIIKLANDMGERIYRPASEGF